MDKLESKVCESKPSASGSGNPEAWHKLYVESQADLARLNQTIRSLESDIEIRDAKIRSLRKHIERLDQRSVKSYIEY